jgi:hypothetical protein
MTMSKPWRNRVSAYLDRLEQIASTIESNLEQTHVDTAAADADQVERGISGFKTDLQELEMMIAQRQELLEADDAPARGTSLKEKLLSTYQPEDQGLAGRCQQVSRLIADVNAKAISLFVCQFHLSDLSAEILRLISGASPSTYTTSDREFPGQRRADQQGGLFNESA